MIETQDDQDRTERNRPESQQQWGDDVKGDKSPHCFKVDSWADLERHVSLTRGTHARDDASACREVLWRRGDGQIRAMAVANGRSPGDGAQLPARPAHPGNSGDVGRCVSLAAPELIPVFRPASPDRTDVQRPK